jgi:hypothetical protein
MVRVIRRAIVELDIDDLMRVLIRDFYDSEVIICCTPLEMTREQDRKHTQKALSVFQWCSTGLESWLGLGDRY